MSRTKGHSSAQIAVINQEDESFSLVLSHWDSLTILDIKLLHGIVLVDHGELRS